MPIGNLVTINNEESLQIALQGIREYYEKNKFARITIEARKQRTLTQNAAMHLYCEHVSQALNEAGFDFRTFIKEGVEVPFNKDLVKEHLWKPIQKAVTGEESTKKPEKHQYSEIYDVLNRHLSNKGIIVPFPSIER
jgi:hypothetical protein